MRTSFPFPGRPRSIHAHARSAGISLPGDRGIKVVADCVILQPAARLHAFCRQPENLARLIGHNVGITAAPGHDGLWSVRAPFAGRPLAWDMIILNDEPGRLLAWQSLEGAPVPNAWTVRFEPASGADTKVTVQLEFDPPGKLAGLFNGLLGKKAKQEVAAALARFKAQMESS